MRPVTVRRRGRTLYALDVEVSLAYLTGLRGVKALDVGGSAVVTQGTYP